MQNDRRTASDHNLRKRTSSHPQSIRKQLKIKPKNKFLVYGKGDTIILKKLELPDIKKEWDKIFEMMDKKRLNLSEEEIQEIVSEVRKERYRK
jgi:bifunctional DNA-binding transcriptional regulator/antitoxin component of YhaV-PrlF toxin-antitoxin module